MEFSTLFERCLEISYTHVENSADYALEKTGNILYLYLECSSGNEDWANNLDFPAVPYKRMGQNTWHAHRGFLRIFKSIEGYIAEAIADSEIRKIVTVGYSHGGALAVLCHEYAWYNRPDIRDEIEGYGFGAPRTVWMDAPSERWENFTVIRNLNDIVTHLPPKLAGYTHVGKMLEIGERGKYTMIDAHRPENILSELLEYEKRS